MPTFRGPGLRNATAAGFHRPSCTWSHVEARTSRRALILGVLTRLSTLLNAAVLVGALLLVKVDIGLIAPMGAEMPGAELEFGLLAGLLVVALLGPGRPSIDHALGIESGTPTLTESARRVAS